MNAPGGARRQRIVVVGAGIAGLSIAHALVRGGAAAHGIEVTVLEHASRPGGNIRTETADGYVYEWGPNGFLDNVPATLELIADLGLRDRLQPSDGRARRRYIVRGGRLHPVPGGPWDFATSRLLSWQGKCRLALEPFALRAPDVDETIHAFASRRIGREAADVLVDSMVSGVFGGDAHALSLRACFPKMWQLEADHGGLVRAWLARRRNHPRRNGGAIGAPIGRLTSLRGGSEELVQGLAARLGNIVRTGVAVRSVRTEGGRYRIEADGEIIAADGVVLACGAAGTARIIRSLDGQAAETLDSMPTAGMVVVGLGYASAAVPRPLDGFGYLVPRSEGMRTLGCLWDSSVYPRRAPEGHVLLRVMIGGATDPSAVALDDDALLRVVRAELRAVLGIEATPAFMRIVRHRTGIPQYTVGHLQRLAHVESRLAAHPGVVLAGNAYRGVSINSCIAEAPAIAAGLLAHCTRTAAPTLVPA